MAEYIPTVYISGPMSGLPEFNYPAFGEAAQEMRAMGWNVINPAENHGGRTDLPKEEYFRADIPLVAGADAIYMLKGWEVSVGAQLEFAVARACGVRALTYHNGPQSPGVAMEYDDAYRYGWEVRTKASEGPRVEYAHEHPVFGALKRWPGETAITRPETGIKKEVDSDEPDLALDAGSRAFRTILDNLWDLHMAKRKDYTGGGHPLANYLNSGRSIGVDAIDIMFARAYEKMHRISALRLSGAAPENESIIDSLYDVANLSLLQVMRLTPGSGYDTDA